MKKVILVLLAIIAMTCGCSPAFIEWYELNIVGKDVPIQEKHFESLDMWSIYDPVLDCKYISLLGAMGARDAGWEYEIWVGKMKYSKKKRHAQTKVLYNGKWYWLNLIIPTQIGMESDPWYHGQIVISLGNKDEFKPENKITIEQALERWKKFGVYLRE